MNLSPWHSIATIHTLNGDDTRNLQQDGTPAIDTDASPWPHTAPNRLRRHQTTKSDDKEKLQEYRDSIPDMAGHESEVSGTAESSGQYRESGYGTCTEGGAGQGFSGRL